MHKFTSFTAALLLSVTGTAWCAGVTDRVTINTSALPSNTKGYLDIVFNGGGTQFQPAGASLLGFSTNGTLNAANITETAGVSGQLPGTVSQTNQNTEYLQAITFGSTISFNLQFSGPALDSPTGVGSGSTFAFSLLNSTLDGAYLTSNQNDGYLFTFNLSPSGQLTPTTYATDTGAASVTTIEAATPEPAGWLPSAFGLLVLAGMAKRFRMAG